MKLKSITEVRNGMRVGNNSMSYDDKHPYAPIILKPIRQAVKKASGVFVGKIRGLSNLSRPEMLRRISGFVRLV